MAVVGAAAGALRPVGHDDVRVTVRLITVCSVGVLDHLDEPVGMGILTKIMAVAVLVVVPVRHRPMLPADRRSGQAASGQ